jgi:hypothetical protein
MTSRFRHIYICICIISRPSFFLQKSSDYKKKKKIIKPEKKFQRLITLFSQNKFYKNNIKSCTNDN